MARECLPHGPPTRGECAAWGLNLSYPCHLKPKSQESRCGEMAFEEDLFAANGPDEISVQRLAQLALLVCSRYPMRYDTLCNMSYSSRLTHPISVSLDR